MNQPEGARISAREERRQGTVLPFLWAEQGSVSSSPWSD